MLAFHLKENSHVLVVVCPGYEKQSGETFAEAIEALVNHPQITKITLLKADTLQKYILAAKLNLSIDEAQAEADKVSSQWEKDNAEALTRLLSSTKVVQRMSWDDCLQHPDYEAATAFINKKYNGEDGGELKRLTRNLVKSFKAQLHEAARKEGSMLASSTEHINSSYTTYNLEQDAVFYMLATSKKITFDYEVTLSERNTAVAHIYKKFCSPERMRSINMAGLDLKGKMADESNIKDNIIESSKISLEVYESIARGVTSVAPNPQWAAELLASFCLHVEMNSRPFRSSSDPGAQRLSSADTSPSNSAIPRQSSLPNLFTHASHTIEAQASTSFQETLALLR